MSSNKNNNKEKKIKEIYNRCHEYYEIISDTIIRKKTTDKKITTSDWLELRHELTLLHGSQEAKEYFQKNIIAFVTKLAIEIAEVQIFLLFIKKKITHTHLSILLKIS